LENIFHRLSWFGGHGNNFMKVFVKLRTNSTTTNSVSISAIITVIENFLISDVTRFQPEEKRS